MERGRKEMGVFIRYKSIRCVGNVITAPCVFVRENACVYQIENGYCLSYCGINAVCFVARGPHDSVNDARL